MLLRKGLALVLAIGIDGVLVSRVCYCCLCCCHLWCCRRCCCCCCRRRCCFSSCACNPNSHAPPSPYTTSVQGQRNQNFRKICKNGSSHTKIRKFRTCISNQIHQYVCNPSTYGHNHFEIWSGWNPIFGEAPSQETQLPRKRDCEHRTSNGVQRLLKTSKRQGGGGVGASKSPHLTLRCATLRIIFQLQQKCKNRDMLYAC